MCVSKEMVIPENHQHISHLSQAELACIHDSVLVFSETERARK